MESQVVTVTNRLGLHARPAAHFVGLAASFASDVWVRRATDDGVYVDAKSVFSVLSLDLNKGDQMEIAAEGPDEAEAVGELVQLVESGLE